MNTIGDLIDDGTALWAVCYGRDCWHMAPLDLEALAVRHGRDQSVMHADLAPRLRCTRCGGGPCGLRVIPTGGGMGWS